MGQGGRRPGEGRRDGGGGHHRQGRRRGAVDGHRPARRDPRRGRCHRRGRRHSRHRRRRRACLRRGWRGARSICPRDTTTGARTRATAAGGTAAATGRSCGDVADRAPEGGDSRHRSPRCGRHAAGRRGRDAGRDTRTRRGARRAHGAQPRHPNRDVVSHHRRRRPRRAPARAQHRALRGRRPGEGVVHASDRVCRREGGGREAGDDRALRAHRRRQARARPRRVASRTRRRQHPQGRRAVPRGACDPRRRAALVRRLSHGVRAAHRARSRQRTHRGRAAGGDHHPDQPWWHRHRRVGAAFDAGAGRDHRRRRAGLSRSLLVGFRTAASRPRRAEGHDDDQHVRPSHHPGRTIGRVPGSRRSTARRCRRVLRERVREPRPACAVHAERSSYGRRRPRAAGSSRGHAVGAARPRDARRDAGGHVAGQGAPHAWSSRCASRSVGHTTDRRSRHGSGHVRAHAGAHGAHPRGPASCLCPRQDAGRCAASAPAHVLRHDRVRDRAHRQPRTTRVAA